MMGHHDSPSSWSTGQTSGRGRDGREGEQGQYKPTMSCVGVRVQFLFYTGRESCEFGSNETLSGRGTNYRIFSDESKEPDANARSTATHHRMPNASQTSVGTFELQVHPRSPRHLHPLETLCAPPISPTTRINALSPGRKNEAKRRKNEAAPAHAVVRRSQ